MPIDVPSGWPEIGLGLVVIVAAVLIYFMGKGASVHLGTGGRYRRQRRIGAGLFIALGVFVVIVGLMHVV